VCLLPSNLPPTPPSSARARTCPSPRTSNGSENYNNARSEQDQAYFVHPPGASAKSTGSHRRPAATTHRPLCSRLCLLRSRAKMIASAPPVPISPISGHTGEAEWSRRDIPVAVSLGTEPRGSSFGGAMKWVVRARHIPRAGSRRRYQLTVSRPLLPACGNGKCARWTDPQGGTSKGR
jgi:hypothetical protein